MSVIVEINRFSGPMDLLLYLIKKEEMDIFDINIHEITKQYLDSVKQMKKLDLEMAGDFIAMASTLIQIKARMLVPQYDSSGEVDEEADPRKDLVKRLLEYQMYQDAGKTLYKRELLGRDVWVRGSREDFELPDTEIIMEEDNALYALISAYRLSLRRVKKAIHNVSASLKSVRDRIREIREFLIPGRQVSFSSMIGKTADQRGELLITFLSVLELAKMGLISVFQSENFSEIHLEAKNEISEDMISKAESYEAGTNTGAIEQIWISDEDRKEMQEPEVVEAATDEEIEIEEAKHGQEIEI